VGAVFACKMVQWVRYVQHAKSLSWSRSKSFPSLQRDRRAEAKNLPLVVYSNGLYLNLVYSLHSIFKLAFY
jgi:hypothetical protein